MQLSQVTAFWLRLAGNILLDLIFYVHMFRSRILLPTFATEFNYRIAREIIRLHRPAALAARERNSLCKAGQHSRKEPDYPRQMTTSEKKYQSPQPKYRTVTKQAKAAENPADITWVNERPPANVVKPPRVARQKT